MLDGGRTRIVGEIYRVDADALARIDQLEGHPRFYVRSGIALSRGPAGVQGYVLLHGRSGAQPIASGDWREHEREKRRARDPLAAGLDDLAHGRPTSRALAALGAMRAAAPRTPKRRA